MKKVLFMLIMICFPLLGHSKGSQFLIFDLGSKGENVDSFNQLNDKINSLCGYPNTRTNTERYADPIYHPDGVLVAISVMESFKKHLNLEELGKLVDELDETWKTQDEKDVEDK